MEADAVRRRLHPEGVVSYVVGCSVERSAVMDVGARAGNQSAVGCAHQLFDKIGETVEQGGAGVQLAFGTGGEMTDRIEWLEGLFRGIKQGFPTFWFESLSAVEVLEIARVCGSEVRETIARLRDAGLDSISGDGVDLAGCGVQAWVEVHRVAHGLGMRTAAGMTFGRGETLERRVDFLEALRRLQEETGGFAAFVPMAAAAPGGRELDGVTAVERLKTLAISRMLLDNIENVQAIGAVQGIKVLQMALRFGANDAGSVMMQGDGSEEDLRRIIRDAGFVPVQRDMVYRTMFFN